MENVKEYANNIRRIRVKNSTISIASKNNEDHFSRSIKSILIAI